jgi:hypothetical protein
MKRSSVLLLSLAMVVTVLSWQPTFAQRACVATANNCPNQIVTSSKIQIGGEGSLSSNGTSFSNPGLLDDGTIAEADLAFAFDQSSGLLTLTVTNQTVTTASLTALGFNVSPDVTGVSLVSHTGSLPWELAFDLDRNDSVVDSHPSLNNLKMAAFGRFSIFMGNKGISTGGNGGDTAEILAGNAVTFVLQVTGNLSNLTACSFTSDGSLIPPGDKIATAVVRFQAGEQGGSGFVGPCTTGDLLISLANFEVFPGDGSATVRWSTASEIDNAGFAIIRRELRTNTVERLNATLIPPRGSSISGANYEFVDKTAVNGVKYLYRLEDFDLSSFNTLHPPETAVANPQRPPIRLLRPGYEEMAGNSVTMRWESDRRVAATLEISANSSFDAGTTMSLTVGAGNSKRLSPRDIAKMEGLATMGDEGGVYWRITGRAEGAGNPVRSQVYFLQVSP